MKKILFLLLLFIPFCVYGLELNSKNALLVNLDDGNILIDEGSTEQIKIASLTKIMTTIVAIENIEDLNEHVVLKQPIFDVIEGFDASLAGFDVNDEVSYLDLLYGVMLPSGADATSALAYYLAGSEEEFVKLMNEKVNELNLYNTKFVNVSGLDDVGQYSTLADVAVILRYALNNDIFTEIFKASSYTTTNGLDLKSSLSSISLKYNIDTSLIIGSKTGFTYGAGLCLASVSTDFNIDYMLLTCNAPYEPLPYHVIDALSVYEHYYENYGYQEIIKTGEVITELQCNEETVPVHTEEELVLFASNNSEIRKIYMGVTDVTSVDYGTKIGVYTIFIDDVLVKTIEVFSPVDTSGFDFLLLIPMPFILGGILWLFVKKR